MLRFAAFWLLASQVGQAGSLRPTGSRPVGDEKSEAGRDCQSRAGYHPAPLSSHVPQLREYGVAYAAGREPRQSGVELAAQGRYADALAEFERALAAGGGDEVRNNIGGVYFLQGRYGKAREAYTAAGSGAQTLLNLGVLEEQLGNYDRALDYYRQASEKAGPAERGRVLSTMAGLYRRRGETARAAEALREAGSLEGLGLLLWDQDPQAALALFRRAEAWLLVGEAERRLGRADAARAAFGRQGEHWAAHLGLGRLDEAEGRKDEALRHYRAALARVVSAPQVPEFLGARRDVFEAAIGMMLDGERPDFTQVFSLVQGPGAVTANQVRARLGSRTLFVQYWLGRGKGTALWMKRLGSGIVRFEAGPKELELLAAGPGKEWEAWSHAAGSLLLAGLPLDGIDELVVVPDGPLHRVPFEALESGSQLLVRRAAVRYAPSAAMLVRPSRARRLAMPWQPLPIVRFTDKVVFDLGDYRRSRLAPGVYWGDALALDLTGAEVATLAECDFTGAGEFRPGFAQALLAAGAASAVTPRWNGAAPELLAAFEARLVKGEPRGQAMKGAQLSLLDGGGERAHPHYWTSFALAGEGGALPPVVPWWVLIAVPIAAVFAVRTLYRRYRQ